MKSRIADGMGGAAGEAGQAGHARHAGQAGQVGQVGQGGQADTEEVAHAWEATPVHDRALRHSVTEHVLAAVRSGRLAPGDRVHETSLARALDVSLSPVRESLFRLADQGWLEHRPRRGFYVRALSAAETEEVYTFRAMLESYAAGTVAGRWAEGVPEEDGPGLAEMERLIAEGERLARAGDTLAVGECNARFHDALVRLAGSALLRRAWALLAPAEWLLIPTWGQEPGALSDAEVADWVVRHRRLLAVLRAGDPAAAAQEAAAHVREAGQSNVRKRFPRGSDEAQGAEATGTAGTADMTGATGAAAAGAPGGAETSQGRNGTSR